MASTRDSFAAFLRASMNNAGLDVAGVIEATDGVVKSGTIYRWLRGEAEGELSVKLLRAVADVLDVPFLEMLAAAGVITAEEAGLDGDPMPPAPKSLEDEIRADRRLKPERKELMIQLLNTLTEESLEQAPARTRGSQMPSHQGIDTQDNEELSG